MILEKIVLDNFRQFQDKNEVVFATGAKNTTVVLGDNGRGKTSLYRALMFCLFGDRTLSQDQGVDSSELTLVNLNRLNSADPRKAVQAAVRLEISHHRNKYVIERALRAVRDEATGIREQVDQAKVYRTDPHGNTKVVEDQFEIENLVSDILDPRLKEYFLFDGERINRLTLASATQRLEVKQGVRRLLNIENLEQAIRFLGATNRRLLEDMDKQASGEFGKVLHQLGECDREQQELEEAAKETETELALAEEEKRRLRQSLGEIAEIKPYIDERNRLEARRNELEEQAKESLTRMRPLVGQAALALVRGTLQRVFEAVNKKRSSGEIPASIRMELIDRIIREGQCICERQVLEETPEYRAVLKWKERAVAEVIEDNALELWRLVSSALDRVGGVQAQFQSEVKDYNGITSDLEKIRVRLEQVSEKIGKAERKDAGKLEASLQEVERKMIELAGRKQNTTEELNQLSEKREKLNAQRELLGKKEALKSEMSERASLVLGAQEALQGILQKFGGEIRRKLGALASETLSRFLDASGRENLRRVVIQDDYSLQILDRWDKPFLANISAGQRQLMSMAFICSLIRAATEQGVLEMPLFMDTPFGRLSSSHRRNLINEIPLLASQWVLLATDTELSRREADALLEGGRWGKCYVLRSGQSGSTKIEEISPQDSLAFLREFQENNHEDVD